MKRLIEIDDATHAVVPKRPTSEILAAASVAVWPTASADDFALARQAAKIALMKLDAMPGVTLDMLAATIATMAPAYRAMIAAAPAVPDARAVVDKDGAELSRHKTLAQELGNIVQDLTVAMQCAVIEYRHGKGAKAGLNWIENTLTGPGYYPDFDAEHGKNAQFWHDTHCSDPMPKCFCGNPSHILSMHGGFCCWEHADQADAAAIAAARTGGDHE